MFDAPASLPSFLHFSEFSFVYFYSTGILDLVEIAESMPTSYFQM
jgi:hypothetical protein